MSKSNVDANLYVVDRLATMLSDDINDQKPEITFPLDVVRIELDPPFPANLEDIDGQQIVIQAFDGDKQPEFSDVEFTMTSTGQVANFFEIFANGTVYLKDNLTNYVFEDPNDNIITVKSYQHTYLAETSP